jgi:DNA-binding MurR/RpiR family transcriptional regulator
MRDQTEISKRKAPARYAAHDVMGYLLDHRHDLSRSHSKIAEAILQHPTAFVEKPIEELVTWIGVSAPTVTRFSRAIGCDDLRDLKLKVMSSMRVGARYLEPATPPAVVVQTLEVEPIGGLEVALDHAASTAFQISGAVLYLMRSLSSLN